MVSADKMMDSYRKQRSGYGVSTGLLASALLQGMTKDLSSFDDLKDQKSIFDEFFNRNNNYPYSDDYLMKKKNDARDKLENAWHTFLNEARKLNIGSEASSMNEGLRTARQHIQQDRGNSKDKEIN